MPSYNNGSVIANIQAGNTTGPYVYTLEVSNGLGGWNVVDPGDYVNATWTNPATTSALTYRWGNPGDETQNIDGSHGLPAGTYRVTVETQDGVCIVGPNTGVVDDYDDGGGGDPEFTCTDAGFTMQATTTGQIDQPSINFASVSQGTLQSVSPSTIQAGATTYTASILIPNGFIGAGVATLDTCQDDSVGLTGGGGDNNSIYLLHASDATGELPGVYDITTATNYYVDANFNQDSDLSVAMSYVFDNQGAQYVPDLVEIPNITAINSTQIPDGTINFPATSNGQPAFFYMIVNQNIGTDLTSVQAFADPNNNIPVAWTSKKAFNWNGAAWWIYNTGANDVSDSLSYNCVID